MDLVQCTELVKPKIESSIANVLLIDGVRSNDEIQVLKELGIVKLLAIHASTDTRFDFLQKEDVQTILKLKNISMKEIIVN